MTWFHRHRWRVQGVHVMYEVNRIFPDVKKPVTEVLVVCECYEFKTFLLDGHWTVAELTPKADQSPSDEAFLKKLGAKL